MLAVGGAYSNPGAGPFPENGLIPFLQPLCDYSWVVAWSRACLPTSPSPSVPHPRTHHQPRSPHGLTLRSSVAPPGGGASR